MRLRNIGTALIAAAAIISLSGCTELQNAIDSAGQNQPDIAGGEAGTLNPQAVATAQQSLASLAVKGKAAKTGYSREQFGPAWTDNVTVTGGGNGCGTRDDILRRDLTQITFKDTKKCVVQSGVLADPYTGKTINFTRGVNTSSAVQIDHMIALGNAWVTGAQQLSAAQRQNFANDPINLQSADGPANGQKSDNDASGWLPPNKAYRCTYVARQIQVKKTYGLWVTSAEKDAMSSVLAKC